MAQGHPKAAKEFKVNSVTEMDTGELMFAMTNVEGRPCQTKLKPRTGQNAWSEGSTLFIDSLGQLTSFKMRDAHLAVSCAMTLGNDPVGKQHDEPETFGEIVHRMKAENEVRNAKFIQILRGSDHVVIGLKDDGTVWGYTGSTKSWLELK